MPSSRFVLIQLVLSGVLISCENTVKPAQNQSENGSTVYMEEDEFYTWEDTVPSSSEDVRNVTRTESYNKTSATTRSNSVTPKRVTHSNIVTLEHYDENYVEENGGNDNKQNYEEVRNEKTVTECSTVQCPAREIMKDRSKQPPSKIGIEAILKKYDKFLKEVDSYIRKPKPWMLNLLSDLNAALVKRKYDFLKEKRNLVQSLMLTSITFNSAPGEARNGSETRALHDCSGKGLTKLLIDLISSIRSSNDKTVLMVKILRNTLYHHLHAYGLWSEQNGADLFALFNLMGNSKNSFDAVATDLEKEWEANFESAVNVINSPCRLGVTGIRVYEEMALAWPRLAAENDEQLDEEKLFKNIFPEDSAKMKEETQLRLRHIAKIEAAAGAEMYVSNGKEVTTSKPTSIKEVTEAKNPPVKVNW